MSNRLLISLSLLVAASGCSRTHYVRIRHPLQVGQVDPNSVPFEAASAARSRGLPGGTLVDEASLTEVTPERVCAQVTLWNLETNPDRGVYENYSIVLLSDQDGVENTDAQVELQQPVVTPMQGFVSRRVPAGTRQVCARRYRNGGCASWRRETVWRTIREPHVWQVQTNPANVCFPNGGFITPSTQRAALEFQFAGAASNFVFEWQFDSAVAGGQPQQQQN